MEGCVRCSCCTNCQAECGCVGEEDEDQTILRVIGVPLTAAIKQAEKKRQHFVLEEEEFFGSEHSEEDIGEVGEEDCSSKSEEEEEEGE